MCKGVVVRRVLCVLERRLEKLKVSEGRVFEVGGLSRIKF